MADHNPNAKEVVDREHLRSFLDRRAQQPVQFRDWELRMLGGFGGYESQAHAQSVANEKASVQELK